MFKKIISHIMTYTLFISLMSCEQGLETIEQNEPSKVEQQTELFETNEIIEADTKVEVKSAMEKISPKVLQTLDILTDYEKGSIYGPQEWDEETWAWKILLKWDKGCDYRPWVREYPLHESKYTFIVVECASGAYQPVSYAYLLDKVNNESVQLKLGRGLDSPEPSREIWGEIAIDEGTNELSIYYVVRGIRDCGVYQKYNLVEGDSVETSNFVVKTTRKQECLEGMRYEDLPDSVFDYKNWPIVDE